MLRPGVGFVQFTSTMPNLTEVKQSGMIVWRQGLIERNTIVLCDHWGQSEMAWIVQKEDNDILSL